MGVVAETPPAPLENTTAENTTKKAKAEILEASLIDTDALHSAASLPGYVGVRFGQGHGKRSNVAREVRHIFIVVGVPGETANMELSDAWNRPSKYNANRAIGLEKAARMLAEPSPSQPEKTRWQALGLGSSLEASACLGLFLCSIPLQDPENDAGLHCTVWFADPNVEDYEPPSDDVVEWLSARYPQGLQIELAGDVKALTGSRANDSETGGMYYIASNLSERFKKELLELRALVEADIEKRSGIPAGVASSFVPHMSLAMLGPRFCRHPKQQSESCGLPLPTRAIYDALRYGKGGCEALGAEPMLGLPAAFAGFDLPEWTDREVTVQKAVDQAKQAPGFLIPEKKDCKTQDLLSAARYTMNPGEAARSIPFAPVVDPSGSSRPCVSSWAAASRTPPGEELQEEVVRALRSLL